MKRLRQISEAYAAKWASVRRRAATRQPRGRERRSAAAIHPAPGRLAQPRPPRERPTRPRLPGQMGASVEALCEQVYVESVETADLLLGTLRYRVPALLASRRVRLVLVDSVGALFRTHLDDDLPRRSELLIQLAAEMKRLSEQMHVAFVVLNQVSDAFDGPSGGALPLPPSLAKRAALGLTWSHCVNTRILLSRGRAQCAGLGPERRTLRLLLSPSAEQGSCEYVIDASGVRDAPALAAPPHEAGGRPWGTSPAAVVAGDSHSRGF